MTQRKRKRTLDNSVEALAASLTDRQREALQSRQQLSIVGPPALVSEGIRGGTVGALRRRGLIGDRFNGHLQLTELGLSVIERIVR